MEIPVGGSAPFTIWGAGATVAEAEGFHEVEFFDQSFRLKPGEEYEWEMMEFASAAKGGADSDMLSGRGCDAGLPAGRHPLR
jgi:hypothetical protein